MALNKAQFKTDLMALMDDLASRIDEPEQARIDYVNGLADLVEVFVKSGTVTVPALGLVAPNGAVTGQANGTIS